MPTPLAEPTEIMHGLSDQRFAYEVIRNLGDSIRALTANVNGLQTSNREILEKVSTMEAQGLLERIAKLELKLETMEKQELKSEGLREALSWFFKSPLIIWLAGLAFAVWSLLKADIAK